MFIKLVASDPDTGDTLTVIITSLPGSGNLLEGPTMRGNRITGRDQPITWDTVAYKARPGFVGFERFKFKVSDGKSDSNVATVTVFFNPLGRDFLWIRQFSPAASYGIAVDGAGNAYVVGRTSGALFLRKYDALGNEVWARQFGSGAQEQAYGVAVDGSGYAYVVGYTFGALPGQPRTGEYDAFVQKHDSGGNVVWTRQFSSGPGPTAGAAYGVAVDGAGNAYVVGEFPTTGGPWVPFVRKYDTSGNELWTRTRHLFTGHSESASGVVVDGEGNVYLAIGDPANGSGRSGDAFVLKYDTSGNEKWALQFGSSAKAGARGVAVDGAGNVYVAGDTSGALPGQTSAGGRDAFVRKYDSSGNEMWTHQFGSSGDDFARGVAVDGAGNAYVAGEGALPGQTSAGGRDAFVRKYDSDGNEMWTHQFGSGRNFAHGVVVDGTGDIYVGGYAAGPLPGQPPLADGALLAKISRVPQPQPIAGDANGDGEVNVADLRIVTVALGTSDWNDLSGDWVVDIFDLALVAINLSRGGP